MKSYLKHVYWKTKHVAEKVLLRKLWCNISRRLLAYRPIRVVSAQIHRWICDTQQREPWSEYTCFLRNRPQLEILSNIVRDWHGSQPFRIAVLACGSGAELYSALWVVRSARPDLEVVAVGIDISETLISAARTGEYERGSQVLDGLSRNELEILFEKNDDRFCIRSDIAAGATWRVVDNLFDPGLVQHLGPQDVVFLNNFLINFTDEEAARSFRNIVDAVVPDGYLFVSGMDLDIRTEETEVSGLEPVMSNIE